MLLTIAAVLILLVSLSTGIVVSWKSLCRCRKEVPKKLEQQVVAASDVRLQEEPIAVTVCPTRFVDFGDSGVSSLSAASSPKSAASPDAPLSDPNTHLSEAGYSEGSSEYLRRYVSSSKSMEPSALLSRHSNHRYPVFRQHCAQTAQYGFRRKTTQTKRAVEKTVVKEQATRHVESVEDLPLVVFRIEAERVTRENSEAVVVLNTVESEVVQPVMNSAFKANFFATLDETKL